MREDQLVEIMAQAIGQEQAQKGVEALVEKLGGSRIDIPTAKKAFMSRRNAEIRRRYREGAGYLVLSKRFNLSEKHIRRICGN